MQSGVWMGMISRGFFFAVPNQHRQHRNGKQEIGFRLGSRLMVRYFSLVSVLILLALAVLLLFLPLVLPPLPPPPLVFLLIPIAIMVVLVFLALVPSEITNVVVSAV